MLRPRAYAAVCEHLGAGGDALLDHDPRGAGDGAARAVRFRRTLKMYRNFYAAEPPAWAWLSETADLAAAAAAPPSRRIAVALGTRTCALEVDLADTLDDVLLFVQLSDGLAPSDVRCDVRGMLLLHHAAGGPGPSLASLKVAEGDTVNVTIRRSAEGLAATDAAPAAKTMSPAGMACETPFESVTLKPSRPPAARTCTQTAPPTPEDAALLAAKQASAAAATAAAFETLAGDLQRPLHLGGAGLDYIGAVELAHELRRFLYLQSVMGKLAHFLSPSALVDFAWCGALRKRPPARPPVRLLARSLAAASFQPTTTTHEQPSKRTFHKPKH
jgi:hypothetical protein